MSDVIQALAPIVPPMVEKAPELTRVQVWAQRLSRLMKLSCFTFFVLFSASFGLRGLLAPFTLSFYIYAVLLLSSIGLFAISAFVRVVLSIVGESRVRIAEVLIT